MCCNYFFAWDHVSRQCFQTNKKEKNECTSDDKKVTQRNWDGELVIKISEGLFLWSQKEKEKKTINEFSEDAWFIAIGQTGCLLLYLSRAQAISYKKQRIV